MRFGNGELVLRYINAWWLHQDDDEGHDLEYVIALDAKWLKAFAWLSTLPAGVEFR